MTEHGFENIVRIVPSPNLLFIACRPAGIPVVPVYEEDEPNTRRKVQRITSPEKWEIKQVNQHQMCGKTQDLFFQASCYFSR